MRGLDASCARPTVGPAGERPKGEGSRRAAWEEAGAGLQREERERGSRPKEGKCGPLGQKGGEESYPIYFVFLFFPYHFQIIFKSNFELVF